MLNCERSLPNFREDMTLRDWEALTEKSVPALKGYTGYVNRLGDALDREVDIYPQETLSPAEIDERLA